MDNFFQLLIFLFIIYAIFNSVFGKKKPKESERKIPQRNSQSAESETSTQTNNSSGDLLEELFGFKIPKTGGEYENYPQNNYPTNLEKDLPVDNNEPEVKYSDIPDVDYDKLPSLELKQNVTSSPEYHTAYEVGNSINKRTDELKLKIRTPNSLKDFYLISEILNKPKAYRK